MADNLNIRLQLTFTFDTCRFSDSLGAQCFRVLKMLRLSLCCSLCLFLSRCKFLVLLDLGAALGLGHGVGFGRWAHTIDGGGIFIFGFWRIDHAV